MSSPDRIREYWQSQQKKWDDERAERQRKREEQEKEDKDWWAKNGDKKGDGDLQVNGDKKDDVGWVGKEKQDKKKEDNGKEERSMQSE